MNPPTIGHKRLIDKTISLADGKVDAYPKGDAFIYASRTVDRVKNPLAPDVKAKYLRKMVPDEGVGIRIVGPASDAVKELERDGYTKIYMVVGSDRMKDFEWVKGVELVSGGTRDPDGPGVEGVKATNVRLGALGLKGKGRANVESRLDPALREDVDAIIGQLVAGLDAKKVLEAAEKEAGAGAAAAAPTKMTKGTKGTNGTKGSKGGGWRRTRRRHR